MAKTTVSLEESLGQEAPAPDLTAQGGPPSEPLRSPLKMTVTAPMGLNLRNGPGWAYVFTGEQAGWVNRFYLAPKPPEEIT